MSASSESKHQTFAAFYKKMCQVPAMAETKKEEFKDLSKKNEEFQALLKQCSVEEAIKAINLHYYDVRESEFLQFIFLKFATMASIEALIEKIGAPAFANFLFLLKKHIDQDGIKLVPFFDDKTWIICSSCPKKCSSFLSLLNLGIMSQEEKDKVKEFFDSTLALFYQPVLSFKQNPVFFMEWMEKLISSDTALKKNISIDYGIMSVDSNFKRLEKLLTYMIQMLGTSELKEAKLSTDTMTVYQARLKIVLGKVYNAYAHSITGKSANDYRLKAINLWIESSDQVSPYFDSLNATLRKKTGEEMYDVATELYGFALRGTKTYLPFSIKLKAYAYFNFAAKMGHEKSIDFLRGFFKEPDEKKPATALQEQTLFSSLESKPMDWQTQDQENFKHFLFSTCLDELKELKVKISKSLPTQNTELFNSQSTKIPTTKEEVIEQFNEVLSQIRNIESKKRDEFLHGWNVQFKYVMQLMDEKKEMKTENTSQTTTQAESTRKTRSSL